jgi:menaquinone-dependent protoporphyrinogen oxidase
MKILVTYASRHGATREIAERIAARLHAAALDLPEHRGQPDLLAYDAFVIGSAAYMGHWLPDASEFVREYAGLLSKHPVWLFSSGPLGTEETDAKGRDLREVAEPQEIDQLGDLVTPRDHHVFFGALDPAQLGFREGLIRAIPAGRKLLPEGDFRDWAEVDAWADRIAAELAALEPAAR